MYGQQQRPAGFQYSPQVQPGQYQNGQAGMAHLLAQDYSSVGQQQQPQVVVQQVGDDEYK